MRRTWLLLLALMVPAGPVWAQDEDASVETEDEETAAPAGPVPVYLPRGAFAGAYAQEGALTPQLRIQWQATLIQMKNDAFVAFLEGGGGFGLSLPSNLRSFGVTGGMNSLYQATVLVGLGYDAVYSSGWAWGFQVLTGPKWYGARFDDYEPEAGFGGTVEGRANIGINVGPVRLMASAGWAQLWVVPRTSIAAQFVGGPIFGVYVDWRPVERRK